ncbi:RNA polymerase factor sigma-54 [Desulfobacterales bacterium HSG16]|nr:RNA polymerase factor sigma-54 [Desulfobacterales bacterium HSG16]
MAIELRQQLKLSQQLVMTPQLQQAIKLLQLSRLELLDTIRQELVENPTLEEVQETAEVKTGENSEAEQETPSLEKEVTIDEKIHDDIDWSNYIDEYNSPGKAHFESEEREAPRYEAFVAHKESLSEHLHWQLMMTSLSDEEKQIGGLIIGNLDKNGYLSSTVEELSESSNIDSGKIESVLSGLQSFDPVGVCAKDLKDCLLIQARHIGCDSPLLVNIIDHHLQHLESKNYKAICRARKVSIDMVVSTVKIIRDLDPRPGLMFSYDTPQYINPDIYVYKMENEFVILLNDDGMPRLRINNFYKNAMQNEGAITGNAKDYMQEKLRSASWLIKSIQQRQKTIYKVMESILKFQKDFFDKGIEHLKPMVLRDVASDIDMHESTVSRVTTNKYTFTPQGIFELKYFFNSSISRVHGEAIASASVQERIRQIIESENGKKPYSDDRISEILKTSNIDIARRTVAKYREMMNILPSNKRRQF